MTLGGEVGVGGIVGLLRVLVDEVVLVTLLIGVGTLEMGSTHFGGPPSTPRALAGYHPHSISDVYLKITH